MAASRSLFALILLAIVLVETVSCDSDVNYRKPPFNGSIFGKRNNGLVAGRVAGQDDRGVCEVLLDACGQLLQSVIDQQGV